MSKRAFNWEELITFSETLISRVNIFPDKEAVYRTVINRVYYGVFKQVEDFLKEKRVSLPTEVYNPRIGEYQKLGSHERVIEFLKDKPKLKSFAFSFERLKYRRLKADYKASYEITKEEAEESLSLAKSLKHLWETLKAQI